MRESCLQNCLHECLDVACCLLLFHDFSLFTLLKSTENSFNLIISFQVLEVGFDVLHFVATCNASNWLIHSTRLSAVEGEDSLSTVLPSNKKQRLDPLVDDTKKDSDEEEDDDDEIITISDSDSEETYTPNSSHRSKRKRQSPKKGSSREHEKQSQVDETLEVNSKGGEEEDGEPSEESRKRKRPASPTTW